MAHSCKEIEFCIFFIRDTFFIQFAVYEVLRVLWEMATKINIKFLTFGVDCILSEKKFRIWFYVRCDLCATLETLSGNSLFV